MAERRYTTEQLESAETIMKMLAAVPKEKRAEVVKARDPMRWAGLMNTLKAQVEEIIQIEVIYQ